MYKRRALLFSLLVVCQAIALSIVSKHECKAQELTPLTTSFNKKNHSQDNHIWSVSCGSDNALYFGNQKGMMRFDGLVWSTVPLPSDKIVRTVKCIGDRIYCGSFREFGYFLSDNSGALQYTSISDKLKDYQLRNEEIWSIHEVNGIVLFQAFTSFFLYDPEDDSVQGKHVDGFAENAGITRDGTIITSIDGMSIWDVESARNIPVPHSFHSRIITVLNGAESDYVVTSEDGIFKYDESTLVRLDTDCEQLLSEVTVNRAMLDAQGNFIIGTQNSGCIAISAEGRLMWHIHSGNALSSNTILGLANDREGNVWLTSDTGISMVHSQYRIRYIKDFEPGIGAVYAIHYNPPYIYLGTDQGLYRGVYKDANMITNLERIEGVNGTWTLKGIDNQLFCGTNGATYELKGTSARAIEGISNGGSCFASGRIAGKDILIEGTYVGIAVFLREGGEWVFSHMIPDFIEPISSLDIDFRGNIWASHNREGMFKLELDESLRHARTVEYIEDPAGGDMARPSLVFRMNGRTIFSNKQCFSTFDDMRGEIVPFEPLNAISDRLGNVRAVSPYKDNSYWFITPQEILLISLESQDARIEEALSLSRFEALSVDMHQDITPGPEGFSFLAMNNSIALVPGDGLLQSPQTSSLQIRSITLQDNDRKKEFRVNLNTGSMQEWDYDYRLLHFEYSYPTFSTPGGIRFEYKLDGRDNAWTDLGSSTSMDLIHLEPGEYTLELKAYTKEGLVLDAVSYPFRIKAPWYLSTAAFIVYAILICSIVMLIILNITTKIRSEKKQVENERLENEVYLKSKEITAAAMSLVEKNKVLLDVKNELAEQKRILGESYPDRFYRRIISSIDSRISSEEDWSRYEENFDVVHSDFFKTLHKRYPDLTPTDLRFCSLFCLNMSSKEIAAMQNISLKGVEAARYRIRKKMGLASEVNLSKYLMELK